MNLLVRWAVLALGVALAAELVEGIRYERLSGLIAVALLLSFFNAILRPILLLMTLPFILLTMGVGVVLINALLFLFAGKLVASFEVDGFFAALLGSLIVSGTNLVMHALLKTNEKTPRPGAPPPPSRPVKKDDDVIDI